MALSLKLLFLLLFLNAVSNSKEDENADLQKHGFRNRSDAVKRGSSRKDDHFWVGEPFFKSFYRKVCKELGNFIADICSNKDAFRKCKYYCGDKAEDETKLQCGLKIPPAASKRSSLDLRTSSDSSRGSSKEVVSLHKRMIGGVNSSSNEWPWDVLLQRTLKDKAVTCNGLVLSDRFVMSSANCFDGGLNDPSEWILFTGDETIKDYNKQKSRSHRVNNIMIHKDYETASKKNNIAILQLIEVIKFDAEKKSRICLPNKKDPLPEDMTCYISGWGNINKNGYPTSPLQHGPVLRIPRNICNLPGNKNGKVGSNELCAGYLTDGNLFCEEDTGASMVCQPKDTWYAAGLFSWGQKCGSSAPYSVYTDVNSFKDWIIETVLNKFKRF